jgi:hypothetical protein
VNRAKSLEACRLDAIGGVPGARLFHVPTSPCCGQPPCFGGFLPAFLSAFVASPPTPHSAGGAN